MKSADFAHTVDHQSLNAGEALTFYITVTNTGAVDLANILIDDDVIAPGCSRTWAEVMTLLPNNLDSDTANNNYLEPGQNFAYACDGHMSVAGDANLNGDTTYVNVATTTGYPRLSDNTVLTSVPLHDADPSAVYLNPDVEIIKSSGYNGDFSHLVDEQAAPAIFYITITNTGLLPLADVYVDDALSPECALSKSEVLHILTR